MALLVTWCRPLVAAILLAMPGDRITYAPAADTKMKHGSLSMTTLVSSLAIHHVIVAIPVVSPAEEMGMASFILVQWADAVSRGMDHRYQELM